MLNILSLLLPLLFLALMGLSLYSTYKVMDTAAEDRPVLRLAFSFALVTALMLILWVVSEALRHIAHPWDCAALPGVIITYTLRATAAPTWVWARGIDPYDPTIPWIVRERATRLNLAKIAYVGGALLGFITLAGRLR